MRVIITVGDDPAFVWEGHLDDAPPSLLIPEDGEIDAAIDEAAHLRAAMASMLRRQDRVSVCADRWRGTLVVQRAEPIAVFATRPAR